jgi:hypothetical protein
MGIAVQRPRQMITTINKQSKVNVPGLLIKSTSVPGGPGRRGGRAKSVPAPSGRGRRIGGAPSALVPGPPGRGRRGGPSSPGGQGRRGGLDDDDGLPSALVLVRSSKGRRSDGGGRAVGAANASSFVPGVCDTIRCNMSGRVRRNTPPPRLLPVVPEVVPLL